MTKNLVDVKVYLVSALVTGLAVAVLIVLGGSSGDRSVDTSSRPASAVMPSGAQRISHVFVIVLENKDYDDTFGASEQAPFLQKTLTAMGAKLTQYYGTAHASLGNYIAMISGRYR